MSEITKFLDKIAEALEAIIPRLTFQNFMNYVTMKGYVYILECSDGSFYTGSTNDIDRRLKEHQNGRGANHTRKRLPVRLVYLEEFTRIDLAYYREKQIQGWNRKKKRALIKNNFDLLPELSKAYRDLF